MTIDEFNIRYHVSDTYKAHRASVLHRVLYVIIQKGKAMKSTNYYVIHKTGRKVKVSCIGFCHDEKLQKAMLQSIAKVEHGRVKDYRIEGEHIVEMSNGSKATQADFKEFTL